MHEEVVVKIDTIVKQLCQGSDNLTLPFGPFYVSRRFGVCTVTHTPEIRPPWVVFTFNPNDRLRDEHRHHFLWQALCTIWACPEIIQTHMQQRLCTYLLAKQPILNSKRRSP